jgi:hypothetical protein
MASFSKYSGLLLGACGACQNAAVKSVLSSLDALLDARVIRQIPEFGEAASVSYCRDSCECELKRLQLAER